MQRMKNLTEILKPARYAGGEVNQIIKDAADVRVRFALAFPDVYEIGMSHGGLRILYHTLNALPGVWAQRVFAPWHDMAAALAASGETLTTLEEQRPLRNFDVVGFSLMYELAYTAVLRMLKLSHIPILAADRGAQDPIIIAGGTATANPMPVHPFFDLITIGDGEELIAELARICLQTPERRERLEAMAKVEGVWRPGDTRRPRRRVVADLDQHPFPSASVMPNTGIVHDRLGVEVARGCTRGCRFCQAGFLYRPYRERAFDSAMETFRTGLQQTGYDELSMLALSITDLSYLDTLVRSLHCPSRQISMGMPSMRVEGMTAEMAEIISGVKKPGFTLAPEAATERLRAVINKGNTEEDLFRSVRLIRQYGWRNLKLYFMIGLPTETQDDIEALRTLSKAISKEFRGGLTVNISAFNPKPFTPFQWEEQIGRERQREIIGFLQRTVRDRFVSLKWPDAKLSLLEGVFARGDEKLSAVIMRAEELGAYLDGWADSLNFEAWLQAFEDLGLDPHSYTTARPLDAELPWEFIDMRIRREFLLEERSRAYAASGTPDCRFGACSACGVCAEDLKNDIKPAATVQNIYEDVPAGRYPFVLGITKTGAMPLMGHRDFIELLKRAVRRAGLQASYSEGFSPSMRLNLTPPLPLGIASLDEYMQLDLCRDYAVDEIRARLGATLPQQVQINSCRPGRLGAVAAYIFRINRPVRFEIPPEAVLMKGDTALKVWDYLELLDDKHVRLNLREGRTLPLLALLNTFGDGGFGVEDVIKTATFWA